MALDNAVAPREGAAVPPGLRRGGGAGRGAGDVEVGVRVGGCGVWDGERDEGGGEGDCIEEADTKVSWEEVVSFVSRLVRVKSSSSRRFVGKGLRVVDMVVGAHAIVVVDGSVPLARVEAPGLVEVLTLGFGGVGSRCAFPARLGGGGAGIADVDLPVFVGETLATCLAATNAVSPGPVLCLGPSAFPRLSSDRLPNGVCSFLTLTPLFGESTLIGSPDFPPPSNIDISAVAGLRELVSVLSDASPVRTGLTVLGGTGEDDLLAANVAARKDAFRAGLPDSDAALVLGAWPVETGLIPPFNANSDIVSDAGEISLEGFFPPPRPVTCVERSASLRDGEASLGVAFVGANELAGRDDVVGFGFAWGFGRGCGGVGCVPGMGRRGGDP